jgi:hypothetical protein
VTGAAQQNVSRAVTRVDGARDLDEQILRLPVFDLEGQRSRARFLSQGGIT